MESLEPRIIGSVVDLPEFEYGSNQRTIPARVKRVATEQEYIDDCLADPRLPEDSRRFMVVKNEPNRWWYEVEVD